MTWKTLRMDEPKTGGYAGVPAVAWWTFTSVTRTERGLTRRASLMQSLGSFGTIAQPVSEVLTFAE